MILVDTNVWVYSMRGSRPEVAKTMRQLLLNDMVVAHDFVYGELLLGTGGLTRKEVIDRYADLRHYPQLPNQDVAAFILKHKLGGKGIGWVDAHLLATASFKGLKLWTEEKNLRAVASTMKMAFEPGKA